MGPGQKARRAEGQRLPPLDAAAPALGGPGPCQPRAAQAMHRFALFHEGGHPEPSSLYPRAPPEPSSKTENCFERNSRALTCPKSRPTQKTVRCGGSQMPGDRRGGGGSPAFTETRARPKREAGWERVWGEQGSAAAVAEGKRPASPPPGRDTPEMQNGGEGLRRAAPGPESAQGISAIFISWKNKD